MNTDYQGGERVLLRKRCFTIWCRGFFDRKALFSSVSIYGQVVKTLANAGFLERMDGHCQRNCQ